MAVDCARDRQALFCPPDTLEPPCEMPESYFFCFLSMNSVACATSHARRTVSSSRSVSPYATLLAIVPLNRNDCCGTYADLVAQRLQLVVAHVDAVDEHLALRGVVETRHEVDEGRFAGAGRADERHRLTLLRLEIDAFEHGVTRVGVGEAHIAEFDFAFLAWLARVLRAVGDHRLGVDDFEHALRGHVARGQSTNTMLSSRKLMMTWME